MHASDAGAISRACACALRPAADSPLCAAATDFFSRMKLPITSTSICVRAKTIERFFGAADDRLVVVERSVQDDRHAGEIAEGANQFPVEADSRCG